MSFLMDELKKAEQSKRASVGRQPPLPGADDHGGRLAEAQRGYRKAPSPSLALNRKTARVLALPLLLVGGGGAAYFWMQIESPAPAVQQATAVAPTTVMQAAPLALPGSSAQRAYAALMAGDETLARSEYLRVLEIEPASLDALHGLAAISLRQGQADAAETYYLRALRADPQDALAQAGLIGLKGHADPQQAEAHLKSLLAAHPGLPVLNYAIGNLYARQNRWNEAQLAFFKAYSAEPDNPDILFNLAVSLDHMQQPEHALQFYKLALRATENRPAGFDKQHVSARLLALRK